MSLEQEHIERLKGENELLRAASAQHAAEVKGLREALETAVNAMHNFGSYAKANQTKNTPEYMDHADGYWARFEKFEVVYHKCRAALLALEKETKK